jgi:hypothetical protein
MFHHQQGIGPVRPMTASEILARFGSEIGRADRHAQTRPAPAAEMRGTRTAKPTSRQAQQRPTAAAGDEKAQRDAEIRDDADRRRKREDPREHRDDRFSSDRIDERRQARDETTKPRYDKHTGERIDEARSAKQERGRGRGLGRSR